MASPFCAVFRGPPNSGCRSQSLPAKPRPPRLSSMSLSTDGPVCYPQPRAQHPRFPCSICWPASPGPHALSPPVCEDETVWAPALGTASPEHTSPALWTPGRSSAAALALSPSSFLPRGMSPSVYTRAGASVPPAAATPPFPSSEELSLLSPSLSPESKPPALCPPPVLTKPSHIKRGIWWRSPQP